MQHEKIGAEGQCAFDLTAKGGDGLGMELKITARQIHQVVGMDDQRLQTVALAQSTHLVALRARQVIGLPLSRAGGKNLERIAAQPVGTLGCIFHSAGG